MSSILILLTSCQQTCITYTIAVCTVKNYWRWTQELYETSRVSLKGKIWEISASSWFILRNLTRRTVTWTSQLDFYLKIGYVGSLKWVKMSTNSCFRLHIYLHTNKTLIHNSLYVFDTWGKSLGLKKMWYNYSKKMFTRRTKSIRKICDSDNQRPNEWSCTVHNEELRSLYAFPTELLCRRGQRTIDGEDIYR